jgi:hypothetical protein
MLDEEPWHAEARAWVNAAVVDEEQGFEDLRLVLHRMWIAALRQDMEALIAEGHTEREQLQRISALDARIREHRKAERELADQHPARR